MKTKKKNGLLATGLLLPLGAIGFAITGDPCEVPLAVAPAVRADGVGTVAPPEEKQPDARRSELESLVDEVRRGAYCAPVGTDLVFDARLRTTATVERAGRAGDDRLVYTVGGTARVTVLDRRKDELAFALSVPDARVELAANGRRAAEPAAALAADLRRPTIVRMREDGTTLGLRFPESMAREHRNWVRIAVDVMRHVIPADAGEVWETVEPDATGRARIRYARQRGRSGDGRVEIEKTKLGYVAARSPSPMQVRGRGVGEGIYDSRLGWIVEARFAERNAIVIPDLRAGIEQELDARMELVSRSVVSAHELSAVDWDGPWDSPLGPNDPRGDARAIQRQRFQKELDGVTVGEIVAEIAQLLEGGADGDLDLSAACRRLLWKLRIDAEAAGRLSIEIERAASRLAGMLLSLAAQAGDEASQGLVAKIATDGRVRRELRGHATRALFLLEEPASVSVAAARRLMADEATAKTGLLLLGAFAGKSAAKHGEDLRARLVELEPAGGDPASVGVWLRSLGNAGRQELAGRILRHVDHESAVVREAAVAALRKLRSPEVTAALLRRVEREVDGSVRARAVEVLTRMPGAAVKQTLLTRARRDLLAAVRRAALIGLGRHGTDPDVRRVIGEVARSDDSEELRAIAADMLRTLRRG